MSTEPTCVRYCEVDRDLTRDDPVRVQLELACMDDRAAWWVDNEDMEPLVGDWMARALNSCEGALKDMGVTGIRTVVFAVDSFQKGDDADSFELVVSVQPWTDDHRVSWSAFWVALILRDPKLVDDLEEILKL
jgi:hypothetical protein